MILNSTMVLTMQEFVLGTNLNGVQIVDDENDEVYDVVMQAGVDEIVENQVFRDKNC